MAKAKKSKVAPALVKNAKAITERAVRNLVAAAREDIALIKERKREISSAFYDIGEALVRLRKKGVPEALGYANFEKLCEGEVGLGSTQVGELIDIVTRIPRSDATEMGQTKAAAFARLAEATPAADTPMDLYARGVRAPSGKRVTKSSPTRLVDAAAKEFRQKSAGKTKRNVGRTTSADERAIAAAIQRKLQSRGIKTAKVTAVASKPGQESFLRIEGIPIGKRKLISAAL